MKSVFLTGSTGLLGRYLLQQLLSLGWNVVVLARDGIDGVSGLERVDDALRHFEETLQRTLPRPTVVQGQLHEPGLGLSAADRRVIAERCSSILHSAASIQFQEAGGEPYRSNVTGTQRLIEFCADAGIREFHHISTAYVCGDRQGPILEEDFQQGQSFRNDYEKSKFTAEQLLREAPGLTSLTIYRPSIIVGDSRTAYSSTFHGFYLPLQLAYLATTSGVLKDRKTYMQALGLCGGERKNLVPVDWVAEVLVQILQQRHLHGRTYHLTNPRPVTATAMDDAIYETIRDSLRARAPSRTSERAPATTLDDFRAQMQVYAAYLSDDPEFDHQHTSAAAPGLPCPSMNHETLVRLGRFAVDVGFGWPKRRPRPVTLNVGELLRQLPKMNHRAESGFVLRLEVTGSYGGAWQVVFEQSAVMVLRDECDLICDIGAYLNVHTLCDILADKQTVAGALSAGQLVFEGPCEQISQGPTLLRALFDRLRQSQCNSGGGIPDPDLPNESFRQTHRS